MAANTSLERQRIIEEVTEKIKSHKGRKFAGDLNIRIQLDADVTTLRHLEKSSTATRQRNE